MKKFLYILLLLVSAGICAYVGMISIKNSIYFPWGQNFNYETWKLVVGFFIIPVFFVFGILKIILGTNLKTFYKFSFLIISFLYSIPLLIRPNFKTDDFCILVLIISSFLSVLLLLLETFATLKPDGPARPSTSK